MRTFSTKAEAHRHDEAIVSAWVIKITDGSTTYLISDYEKEFSDGHVHGLLLDEPVVNGGFDFRAKTWEIQKFQLSLNNLPYRVNTSGRGVTIAEDLAAMIGKTATGYLMLGADCAALADCVLMQSGVLGDKFEAGAVTLETEITDGTLVLNRTLPQSYIKDKADGDDVSFANTPFPKQRCPIIYGSWLDSYVKGFATSGLSRPKFIFAGHAVKSLSNLAIKTPGGSLPEYESASYYINDGQLATAKGTTNHAILTLRPTAADNSSAGYGTYGRPNGTLPEVIDGSLVTYSAVKDYYDHTSAGVNQVRAEMDYLFPDDVIAEFFQHASDFTGTCSISSGNVITRLTGDYFPLWLPKDTIIIIDGIGRRVDSVTDRSHLLIQGTTGSGSDKLFSIAGSEMVLTVQIAAAMVAPFVMNVNTTFEPRLYFGKDDAGFDLYSTIYGSITTLNSSGDIYRPLDNYDASRKDHPYQFGIYVQEANNHGDGNDTVNNNTVFRVFDLKMFLGWYLNHGAKTDEENEGYAYCEGRAAGSWLNGRNSYATGDLIMNPSYIVESLLRDELGVSGSDIETAGFDDAYLDSEPDYPSPIIQKMRLQVIDEVEAFDLIRTIAEQSNFIFVFSTTGKARCIRLNSSPTTNRIITWDQLAALPTMRKLPVFANHVEATFNKSMVTGENTGSVTVDNTATQESGKNVRRWDGDWPFQVTSTFLTQRLITNTGTPVALWAYPKEEIEFDITNPSCADLEAGDWIELDGTSVDPHGLDLGNSWAGRQFLIVDEQHGKLGSKFRAVKPF